MRSYATEELVDSYKAWLEAAIKKAGKQSDLLAAIRRSTPGSAEQKELRRVTAETLRQWVTRGSLPSETNLYVTPKLITVVESLVPTNPDKSIQSLDFASLIDALAESRRRSSKSGLSQLEVDKMLYDRDFVTHEVQKVADFRIEQLGLGSWFRNGSVPNYCQRDIDAKIVECLNQEATGVLTISGPPKAGKTRSLIENLKRSKLSKSRVYWLNPYSDSIEQVIQNLKPNSKHPNILVLDDIQRFKFDRTGLNYQSLSRLMEKGVVVATVHELKLARWKISDNYSESDSDLLPSKRVIALLSEGNIALPSKLTDKELANADRVLKPSGASNTQLRHLASWLSSVDALSRKAAALSKGNTYEQALFSALIDSRIVQPEGISLDRFMQIAEIEHSQVDPNSPWFPEIARTNLTNLTSGLTPGSPHAIMVRTPDNPELYMISDFIWETFKPENWQWSHLQLDPNEVIKASETCYFEGLYQTVVEMLSQPEFETNHQAQMYLARSLQITGNMESAERHFRIAAESGDEEAIDLLLMFLYSRQRYSEALEIAETQNYEDNPEGRYKLSVLYDELGRTDLAKIELALCGDLPEAIASLAWLSFKSGECELGEELAKKALRLGYDDPLTRSIVGSLYQALGRFSEALEAMEHSHFLERSGFDIGRIYLAQQKFDRARYYFKQAIENKEILADRNEDFNGTGDHQGFSLTQLETHLALALLGLGNEREAIEILQRLSEKGYVPAMVQLVLYFDKCKKKKDFGVSTLKLADCLSRAGDFEHFYQSLQHFESYFRELLDSYKGPNELAVVEARAILAYRMGNFELGQTLTDEAVATGSKSALYFSSVYKANSLSIGELDNLVEHSERPWLDICVSKIYFNRNDFGRALIFAERAVASGDDYAVVELGRLYWELGQEAKAKALYQKYPFNADAISGLAHIYDDDDADIGKVAELYLRAWNLGSSDCGAEYGLALMKQGNFQAATEVLQRLANEKNVIAINSLKMLYLATNNATELSALKKKHPKFTFAEILEPVEMLLSDQKKQAMNFLTADLAPGPNEKYSAVLEILYDVGQKTLALQISREMPGEAWSYKYWEARYYKLERDALNELRILNQLSGLGYWKVSKRLAELAEQDGRASDALRHFRDALSLGPETNRDLNVIKSKVRTLSQRLDREKGGSDASPKRTGIDKSSSKTHVRKESTS